MNCLAKLIHRLFFVLGGKPVDPCATNSVFELLQQLCCTQDEYVADRVTVMLNWLVEVAKISLQVRIG